MAEKALLSLEHIVNSLMSKILPVSRLLSFTTIKGFLLRYITLLYLNCLRNGMPQNLKVSIKCQKKMCFTTHQDSDTLYWTLNFKSSSFPSQFKSFDLSYQYEIW